MNFKPTEQLTDLVNDLQTSQNDLPTRRSADQLASWLTDSPSDKPTDWWLIDQVMGRIYT